MCLGVPKYGSCLRLLTSQLTFLSSNRIFEQYSVCEGQSSQQRRREQSFLPRETLLKLKSSQSNRKNCQTLTAGQLSNTSSCIIVYTLCICLRTVPRKLCCRVIRLHCGFPWIYCQQSSDPAIHDRCADLLRVFSLLKTVSIIYLTQRPHVTL